MKPSSKNFHQLQSLPLGSQETFEPPEDQERCGIEGRKPLLPVKDVYILVAQLLCLAMATLTIFWSGLAIFLGQVNQLIVIGFLLAIMALCLESQAKSAAVILAGSRKNSTIQDFDALMRKDLFATGVHWSNKILLLLLLGLPLGLSVSYKKFIGGHTTTRVKAGAGFFGCAATPGNQRIGDGLSLIADVYVPFWIDPAINKTYGYNLLIVDNQTAAVVDTPWPDYLTSLQSSLIGAETMSLTATVNATVSEMVNPTIGQRGSDDYWTAVAGKFATEPTVNGGDIEGANNALWAGMRPSEDSDIASNHSVIFMSAWNSTKNETFESEAIRTEQTRRLVQAEWLVTSSNVTLTKAALLPNSVQSDQTLIQENMLSIQALFSTFLGEYDWHNRAGGFDFPYPSGSSTTPRWYQPVNTVPALSAAMLWARLTSLDTSDRPGSSALKALTGYNKAETEITTIKTFPTLRRSPLLMIVLLINPLFSVFCTILKVILHKTPVGDDFNAIALLAAASESDLSVLKGAALTGALSRKVRVTFTNVTNDQQEGTMYNEIVLTLDIPAKRGRVSDGTAYG